MGCRKTFIVAEKNKSLHLHAKTAFVLNFVAIIAACHSSATVRLAHKLAASHNYLRRNKNSVAADCTKSLDFAAGTSFVLTIV